jgi:hypothetical protein
MLQQQAQTQMAMSDQQQFNTAGHVNLKTVGHAVEAAAAAGVAMRYMKNILMTVKHTGTQQLQSNQTTVPLMERHSYTLQQCGKCVLGE